MCDSVINFLPPWREPITIPFLPVALSFIHLQFPKQYFHPTSNLQLPRFRDRSSKSAMEYYYTALFLYSFYNFYYIRMLRHGRTAPRLVLCFARTILIDSIEVLKICSPDTEDASH